MRRDLRRKRKVDNSIVLGIVCAILVMISIVIFAVKNYSAKNKEFDTEISEELAILENAEFEDASTEYGKTVDESKNELNNISNTLSEEENVTNTHTNTAKVENVIKTEDLDNKNEEVTENKEEVQQEMTFVAPVKGDILRGYATENLVFSETLQEWVIHNGVDIKAEKTTVVGAVSSGKVLSIKNDPRYGLTVIIEHQNGFKSVYSNLLTAEFVIEGEEVSEGQTIGTVGTTAAFEISDDYHLHFELLQNDEYVDPTIYINFE